MEEMVALKKHFKRERWIEVDMAWHEHIYEMSANPFLISLRRYFIRFITLTLPQSPITRW